MRETLLLLDPVQLLGIVTLAPITLQYSLKVVADHLADFFVAMLRTNLIHRDLRRGENHQLSRLSAHSPAGVVGMHHGGLRDFGPQSLIGRSHHPSGLLLGILAQRDRKS